MKMAELHGFAPLKVYIFILNILNFEIMVFIVGLVIVGRRRGPQ